MLVMFQTNAQKDIDSCYVIMIRTNQRRFILKQKRPKIALSQGDAQFFILESFLI